MNACDLMPCGFGLLVIQLRGPGASQSAMRAVHDCGHHLQIAQQFGGRPGRSHLLGVSLRFEEQLGIVQNAFAGRRRAFAPSRIQLPGFAGVAVMFGEDRRHSLAVLRALTRHRHQKLHRHLCQDLALAHLLLDGLSQKFRQRQPPRYPTHTTIETARQLIQSVAEALLHLGQQPAHLQRTLVFG